jgi:hypothetical protein
MMVRIPQPTPLAVISHIERLNYSADSDWCYKETS